MPGNLKVLLCQQVLVLLVTLFGGGAAATGDGILQQPTGVASLWGRG